MTNVNVAVYDASGGLARLNSGGRIETPVRFTATGTYTFEVIAGGDAAAGVMPQVGITVDGATRTNWFCTTSNLTRYPVALSVTVGTRRIGLIFLNDIYSPPEDRNARFDRVSITPPIVPRISGLTVDPVRQVATLQWETTAGKSCDVQIAANLVPSGWQVVQTLTSGGSVASWQDTDFSPLVTRRFYRIRQAGP